LITGWTIPDIVPPSAPTNLGGQFSESTGAVSLSWGVATDNVDVVRYDVYRNLTRIGSSVDPTTTFNDSAAPGNVRLSYIVVAVDEFGNNSTSSNAVWLVTDTQRPTTPSGLRISAIGTSSVSLAWTPSTDNFGVSKYRVYRNGVQVATQSWTSGT